MPEDKHYHLRWITEGDMRVTSQLNLQDIRLGAQFNQFHVAQRSVPFTITAGEQVQPLNRIVLEISSVGRSMPLYVPITVLG